MNPFALIALFWLVFFAAILSLQEPKMRTVDCDALYLEITTDMHAELFDRACPNYFLESTL